MKTLQVVLVVLGLSMVGASAMAAERESDKKLHPDQQKVLDWIEENADDPDIEIVRWYAPVHDTKSPGVHFVRLKYRANQGDDGKKLHDDVWRIQDGKTMKYDFRWRRAILSRWDSLVPVR